MIVAAAPAISAAQAAQRLANAGGVTWSRTPRLDHLHDVVSYVAAAPTVVLITNDVRALEVAWQTARREWRCEVAEVPVAFGYLSYDLGMRLVGGQHRQQVGSGWPPMEFRFYDAVLEVNAAGATRILAQDANAAARLQQRLQTPAVPVRPQELLGPLVPLEPPEAFLHGVQRVAGYLRAGDVYQVNLARRLTAPVVDAEAISGLALALALDAQAPAPFGFWFGPTQQAPGRALVGNSPERFLRRTPEGLLETCPIKGTRRRLPGLAANEDPQVLELTQSLKDRAEHDMIVDLERNDLGRVCEVGSVRVVEHARALHLPTVHHLVSVVQGQQRPIGLVELLQATFPGGSITGAPKRRAMEIISEIETAARGPYTGATGWLGAAGDLDMAVAIRTASILDQQLLLWVGGGIVADSEPEAELAETETKAQAFARLWQIP